MKTSKKTDNKAEIEKIRKKIDAIDNKIVELLKQRIQHAQAVADDEDRSGAHEVELRPKGEQRRLQREGLHQDRERQAQEAPAHQQEQQVVGALHVEGLVHAGQRGVDLLPLALLAGVDDLLHQHLRCGRTGGNPDAGFAGEPGAGVEQAFSAGTGQY